jgi:hypothetical protein
VQYTIFFQVNIQVRATTSVACLRKMYINKLINRQFSVDIRRYRTITIDNLVYLILHMVNVHPHIIYYQYNVITEVRR